MPLILISGGWDQSSAVVLLGAFGFDPMLAVDTTAMLEDGDRTLWRFVFSWDRRGNRQSHQLAYIGYSHVFTLEMNLRSGRRMIASAFLAEGVFGVFGVSLTPLLLILHTRVFLFSRALSSKKNSQYSLR